MGIPLPRGSGMGLSLSSVSEGADERLSVERPLKSGCDDRPPLPMRLTAGVGGGGPRGRFDEPTLLARLVAEP